MQKYHFLIYAWTKTSVSIPHQKKLSGHPNVVQFSSAASIGKEESDTGQAEFLILTELCKGTVSSPPLIVVFPMLQFCGQNWHRHP